MVQTSSGVLGHLIHKLQTYGNIERNLSCPHKLTNVIQTSQNSPWLSLRSLYKWYGVFAPQYHEFSQYRRRSVLKQSRKKASKGPHFTFMSDQRPHPSAAKSWSRCNSPLKYGVSQCFNVDCIPGKWGGVAVQHAVEKTFLVAQPVQPVALTSQVTCY